MLPMVFAIVAGVICGFRLHVLLFALLALLAGILGAFAFVLAGHGFFYALLQAGAVCFVAQIGYAIGLACPALSETGSRRLPALPGNLAKGADPHIR